MDKGVCLTIVCLSSKGPMGLSGYPGMMGPKGEPVSTTLSLSHKKSILAFCFSPSFSLSEYKAALILR